MKSKTLLFCTSYFTDQAQWASRYERWLKHHLAIAWPVDSVAMIDDGSPYRPQTDLVETIDAASVGRVALPRRSLIRFKDNLGRQSSLRYPGWWRSFQLACDLAEIYGFTKIVHVESDSYVLSERMLETIDATNTGWNMFWSAHFKWPETAIQVICEDALSNFAAIRDKGPHWFRDLPAEEVLPLTHVVKDLIGDRYADFHAALPAKADYAVQVAPSMKISVPGSIFRRLKYNSLLAASGSTEPLRKFSESALGQTLLEDPGALLQRGMSAYQRGDFAMAIASLEIVSKAVPDDPNVHKYLAAAFMQENRVEEALASGERAARITPGDAGVLNMLGAFYAFRDDTAHAFEHWSKALELDPADLAPLDNMEALEARLSLSDAISVAQRQLTIDRLVDRLVATDFSRKVFNALLHIWDPDNIASDKVNYIIKTSIDAIEMLTDTEARGLVKAAQATGDVATAQMLLKLLGPAA